MTTNFDLISDLYLESMEGISWENKATSLFCIVAGNISHDHDVLFDFLEHISNYYQGVFFIDGPLEHENFGSNLTASYDSLKVNIDAMKYVFFMHENIIILPDVALLGTNGWTTFDFTRHNEVDSNMDFLSKQEEIPEGLIEEIFKMAITDQYYLRNSVETFQELNDIENLIIISNAVPRVEFILHNDDYNGTIKGDMVGNSGLIDCLIHDTKQKTKSWLFGRYPEEIDYQIGKIRYASNPAKNKDFKIYYPKIIKF